MQQVPCQSNDSDCGVFMCKFAAKLFLSDDQQFKDKDFAPQQISNTRAMMVNIIKEVGNNQHGKIDAVLKKYAPLIN